MNIDKYAIRTMLPGHAQGSLGGMLGTLLSTPHPNFTRLPEHHYHKVRGA